MVTIDRALSGELAAAYAETARRLQAGHVEYGNTWRNYTEERVLEEIRQEADDLIGWATILAAKQDPETEKGKRIQALARAIASCNLPVRSLINAAESELHRGAPGAPIQEQAGQRGVGPGPGADQCVGEVSPGGQAGGDPAGAGEAAGGRRLRDHRAHTPQVASASPRGPVAPDTEWYGVDEI